MACKLGLQYCLVLLCTGNARSAVWEKAWLISARADFSAVSGSSVVMNQHKHIARKELEEDHCPVECESHSYRFHRKGAVFVSL